MARIQYCVQLRAQEPKSSFSIKSGDPVGGRLRRQGGTCSMSSTKKYAPVPICKSPEKPPSDDICAGLWEVPGCTIRHGVMGTSKTVNTPAFCHINQQPVRELCKKSILTPLVLYQYFIYTVCCTRHNGRPHVFLTFSKGYGLERVCWWMKRLGAFKSANRQISMGIYNVICDKDGIRHMTHHNGPPLINGGMGL